MDVIRKKDGTKNRVAYLSGQHLLQQHIYSEICTILFLTNNAGGFLLLNIPKTK